LDFRYTYITAFSIRLFYVDELLNYRVLDNDEVLLKILKEALNSNTGIMKSMLNYVEKKLS